MRTMEMLEVAKLPEINLGRTRLFSFLRNMRILMSDQFHKNMPYQKYIDLGYFEIIKEPFLIGPVEHIRCKTVVTSEGLEFIKKILRKNNAGTN